MKYIKGYKASFFQRRLWFLYKLDATSLFYNISYSIKISSQLNVRAFSRALEAIVNRHEILRTNIVEVRGGPIQVIYKTAKTGLEIIDLSEGQPKGTEKLASEITKEVFNRPFKLESDPLYRFKLIKLAKNQYYFLSVFHHVIVDAWSFFSIFLKELTISYQAYINNRPNPFPPLEIQFKDYAEWEQSGQFQRRLKSQERYWLKQLSGELPRLNLPTDNPRPPIQTDSSGAEEIEIDQKIVERVYELCEKYQVTPFVFLLTAFNIFLSRIAGQQDIIIGTQNTIRDGSQLQSVFGPLVNSVIIRVDLSSNLQFNQLLKLVREKVMDGFTNKDYPFELLIEKLNPSRDLSRPPIFNVLFQILRNFDLQDFKNKDFNIGPWDKERLSFERTFQVDVRVAVLEGFLGKNNHSLRIRAVFNSDLYVSATIRQWLERYSVLIKQIVANPNIEISGLSLLGPKETHQLIYDLNNTKADYPKNKTLGRLFQEQAKKTPNNPAVIFNKRPLTFKELDCKTNQLANYLINQYNIKAETPVAIMMERSPEMIMAIIAILKAGGCYVPIDPGYPKDRIGYMIKDSQAPVVITQNRHEDKLGGLRRKIICLDKDWQDKIGREGSQRIISPNKISPANLAYIIYTSGTMGRPKGVMVEQQSAVNFLYAIKDRVLSKNDKTILASTNLTFDISNLEILLPLISGLTMVLASQAEQKDPGSIIKLIKQYEIDIIQFTPSFFKLLAEKERQLKLALAKVKNILIGGEPLPERLLNKLQQLTEAKIYNLYGPTETTIWSTIKDLTKEERVSIGRPIANTQVYILDQNLNIQPIGIPGELYLSGDGLARGYLNQPQKTKEAFLSHPFIKGPRIYKTGDMVKMLPDGNIEYIGRADHQVKIRGNRVELGEIESNLAKHPKIKQAVVAAKKEDKTGEDYLVAYYIPKTKATSGELRAHLKNTLPDYMIPSFFIQLDNFPLNASGKLDRLSLPSPDKDQFINKNRYQPPTTQLEQKLAQIWQEVLGIKRVGINDNFFEAGGNSLKLLVVSNRINEAFKKTISPIKLFEFPTILSFVNFLLHGSNKEYVIRKNKIDSGKNKITQMFNRKNEKR